MAGYFSYPDSPAHVSTKPPGSSDSVTAMMNIYSPPPPPASRNKFWTELNKRLGTTLNLSMVPDSDYGGKFATMIAGDDLPDIMMIAAGQPKRPQLLQARFQPLTEHLSGDAVKDYPFLANIPTDAWKTTVYNGEIYGLALPRPIVGSITFLRTDIAEKRGLDPAPKNYADFLTLCKGLSDTKDSRWALGDPGTTLAYIQEMLKIPNTWSEQGGKFTAVYTTDEYRKAISSVRDLIKAGAFHPDWPSSTTVQRKDWFGAGKTAINYDAASSWGAYLSAYRPANPQMTLVGLPNVGYDGGTGSHRPGATSYALVSLRKAAPGRIKELLRIANWLAAPFGTDAYLFRKYGLKNVDYTVQKGLPSYTDLGKSEMTVPIAYIADAPPVLGPDDATLIRAQYKYQQDVVPLVIKDPTSGIYSDTAVTKAGDLGTPLSDVQTRYFQGRADLSDWDDAVKKWRSDGGDQIGAEYEKSFALAN